MSSDMSTTSLDDSDRELLAQYAPDLRFDRGELFTPTAVEGYVEASQLVTVEGAVLDDVDASQLDGRWSPGTSISFLSSADRCELGREDIARVKRRMRTARLGRVGLFGRLIDALFLLSVWLRPTCPRNTTAAAAAKADRLDLQRDPVCYGRVFRAGEWLVLHYAYFYVMNDWRSGFRGLNDHEGDWEQAWIFCDPEDHRPIWITTSSHDYKGADLRRHWDDPELLKRGSHPALFAGAGSHALFYRPGDYVTRVDVPGIRWVLRAQRGLQRVLRIRDAATERGLGPALGVPFIDTNDGSGPVIEHWNIRSMDTPWVERFRGLWGRDTGDPLQAERGPSGPKFDRSGEIRASWADPLGFAGLHGTPPPSAVAARVTEEKLSRVLDDLDEQIRHRARMLPLAHQTDSAFEMAGESARLTQLLRHRCELEDLRERIELDRSEPYGIRDHLRHPAVALEPVHRSGWMLASWAALSVPMFLIAAASVLLVDRLTLGAVALVLLLASWPLEFIARRQYGATIRLLTVEVALVAFSLSAFGLVAAASRYVLGGLLLVAGAVLLVVNASELRSVLVSRRQRSSTTSYGSGQDPTSGDTAASRRLLHASGGGGGGRGFSAAVASGKTRPARHLR